MLKFFVTLWEITLLNAKAQAAYSSLVCESTVEIFRHVKREFYCGGIFLQSLLKLLALILSNFTLQVRRIRILTKYEKLYVGERLNDDP